MTMKLLLDYLTGEMALVNVPAVVTPSTPVTGNPIAAGFFMFLTYA